jgi:TPR repeat protein
MRAAQSDHPGALFVLGYMLFESAHNDREVYDALKHLKKSSQLGHHPAQSYLGSILLNNATTKKEKRKALDLLKTAALAGSNDAARTLYHIYVSGLYEEKSNPCIANFWFALILKKDSFTHDLLGAKDTDCFIGERITFSE